MPKPKYRTIADALRGKIENGELSPGDLLPHTEQLMEQFRAAKSTVRAAVDVLAQEGLVVARRRYGTVVRDRRTVRIPLSRYRRSLESSGELGPFEAACKEQGLSGVMKFMDVGRVHDARVAALLGLTSNDALVFRRRHALINNQVVQFQQAWYPLDVAEAADLERQGKIDGGVYRALALAGIPAVNADERVWARMPAPDEAEHLGIGASAPVLAIERVSRGADGRPIEVLQVVAAGDRMELTFEELPLPGIEST